MNDRNNLALGVVTIVILFLLVGFGLPAMDVLQNISKAEKYEAEALLVQAQGLSAIAKAQANRMNAMTGLLLIMAIAIALFLIVFLYLNYQQKKERKQLETILLHLQQQQQQAIQKQPAKALTPSIETLIWNDGYYKKALVRDDNND